MANHSYTYEMKYGKGIYGLMSSVSDYLSETEKMETQLVTSSNGTDYIALQARLKGGGWKQIFGMDKAITVRFIEESSSSVRMEIGEAKWIDKGGIMLLSMFVLWPLSITSGIGMYKQGSLPGKIRSVADKYTGVTAKEVLAKEQSKERSAAYIRRELEILRMNLAPLAHKMIMDVLWK